MITTHVLDTAQGRPAQGIKVTLERKSGTEWSLVGQGQTNSDGRIKDLLKSEREPGVYRLVFQTGAYLKDGFYPEVPVVFEVKDASQHYHVPILLSPYGFSTYRGS